MKKIYLNTALISIFNPNITKATEEVKNWNPVIKPVTVIDQGVYNSDYSIILWFMKLSLFIFITSVIIYSFYYFKKNNKKKGRVKKIIRWSFGFFLISFILFWLLFLVTY